MDSRTLFYIDTDAWTVERTHAVTPDRDADGRAIYTDLHYTTEAEARAALVELGRGELAYCDREMKSLHNRLAFLEAYTAPIRALLAKAEVM